MTPQEIRLHCRSGEFQCATAGVADAYIQTNLMMVPREHAFDFLLFCQRNPLVCPLIEVLEPGQTEPRCAPGADLRTDLPGYRVYRDGELLAEVGDIHAWWRDDLVSFLIGCSFSFEAPLLRAGIPLRHVEQRRNVAMYRTNLDCMPAGRFAGQMVVSMRPIAAADVARAVLISGAHPEVHGEPVQVGFPEQIGISDLSRPDYGDPVDLLPGELPVFWRCGVTPQWVAQQSRLPFWIAHAPGKMFVTDQVL